MADGLMTSNPYAALLNMGLTPELAQQQVNDQRAAQFATMSPDQRRSMGIYQGISRIAGALGAKDPMLEQASKMREMASQFDTTTAEGLMQYARALQQTGNIPAAQQAAMQARQMMEVEAKTAKTKSETAKFNLTVQQEEKLRQELAALPDDSSDEDVAKVVRKYGDPDKILKSIESRQAASVARQERSDAREREIRLQTEGKLEVARLQGANAAELARIRAQGASELAQIRQDMKAGNAPKPTAGDRRALESAQGIIQQTQGTLDRLDAFAEQIDKGELKFGFFKNLQDQASVATGRAGAGAVEKDKFNRFVLEAANNLLLLAKGTQTEGDAQRARDQVVGALSKNDTNAVRAALDDLRSALSRTQSSADVIIQNYNEDFGTSKRGLEKTPAKNEDKFIVGKIYQDGSGNKAKYLGNGKWENM